MCQPNKIPFFFRPFWGCLLLLFLRPGASPLAIPFLPFGHNNLRLVLGFAYALSNLQHFKKFVFVKIKRYQRLALGIIHYLAYGFIVGSFGKSWIKFFKRVFEIAC